MSRWFCYLLVGFVLNSCGPKESSTPIDGTIQLEDDNELREALAKSSVTCMERSCPNNVAKLIFWQKDSNSEGYSFGVCSGTLIDSDTILTNAHCVPSEISYNGANCNGQIMIQYPEIYNSDMTTENVDCLRVQKVYSYLNGEPDVALLKVVKSRYIRDRVRIRANQMDTQQNVHAYTMNPSRGADRFAGYIYKKTCKISQHNILTGVLKSHSSDALLFGYDCNVISGNSGSGLFNNNRDLIGVVHSKIDKKELLQKFRDRGIKYSSMPYMGLFVNIGCIESLREQFIGPQCEDSLIATTLSLDNYIEQLKEQNSLIDVNDSLVRANIGEGLKLSISPYHNPDLPLWRRRDNLSAMRRKLLDLFNSSQEGAWAKLVK
jgi:V8-like Glu-specific endopeptidase